MLEDTQGRVLIIPVLFGTCFWNEWNSIFPTAEWTEYGLLGIVCSPRRPCWKSQTIKGICRKIKFVYQRKIILLFRSSNMVVVSTLYTQNMQSFGKVLAGRSRAARQGSPQRTLEFELAFGDVLRLAKPQDVSRTNSSLSSSSLAFFVHTLCFFFYKNLFYKNVEAEINQNFKNLSRTFLRLRVD